MSVAIDEATDIGVAHLCYIKFVHDGCVSEDFLSFLPLLGTTTGEDIFKEFMNYFRENELDIKK